MKEKRTATLREWSIKGKEPLEWWNSGNRKSVSSVRRIASILTLNAYCIDPVTLVSNSGISINTLFALAFRPDSPDLRSECTVYSSANGRNDQPLGYEHSKQLCNSEFYVLVQPRSSTQAESFISVKSTCRFLFVEVNVGGENRETEEQSSDWLLLWTQSTPIPSNDLQDLLNMW